LLRLLHVLLRLLLLLLLGLLLPCMLRLQSQAAGTAVSRRPGYKRRGLQRCRLVRSSNDSWRHRVVAVVTSSNSMRAAAPL
jgi:hypothetical protein